MIKYTTASISRTHIRKGLGEFCSVKKLKVKNKSAQRSQVSGLEDVIIAKLHIILDKTAVKTVIIL